MEPTIQIIDQNTISGKPPYRHDGDEFVYIIEGKVKIILDKKEIELNEEDSMYFDANVPHSIVNESDKKARVLFVTSPSFF